MNILFQVKSDSKSIFLVSNIQDFVERNLAKLEKGIEYIYEIKKIFGDNKTEQRPPGFEMLKVGSPKTILNYNRKSKRRLSGS